jgi:hypothetical protein
MERHALTKPAPLDGIGDVVAAICGAHAQVMSAAELSISLRLDGATRQDVRRALWKDRTLVKTYGPRGTVHLLPARDLPMWTGALSAIPVTSALPQRALMTAEQTSEVIDAISGILESAELTLDALGDAVTAATGRWAGDLVMPAFGGMWPRWRQALSIAAHRGALCFGQDRGRRVTYTSPRRWLSGFSPAGGDSASIELARRYLHAYGPAAPAHFAQWLAAPRRWATAVFDALGDEIVPVALGGEPAWALAGDTSTNAAAPAGVRLLPYFDAFVVGSHPRRMLFPGRAAERALAGSQAGNFPVLLVDGVVTGVWHHRHSGRWIDITVEPLDELTADQRRELDEQAEHVGRILEGDVRLSIGQVTVGPHA